MKRLDVTEYTVPAPIPKGLTCAVLSDIHGEEYGYILDNAASFCPDVILIPGDLTHSHISVPEGCGRFLADCVSLAPVFFSYGNHENQSKDYVKREAQKAGAVLLDNRYATFGGIVIGGLTSGYLYEPKDKRQGHWRTTPPPNLAFLREFDALDGFRVLLCHHPEYYPVYLRKDTGIDVILSGHAHGGQWRIFGQPVFAPGQGLFPRFAQGMHDGRLIVSRGLANNGPVPRFFNRRELVILHLAPSGARG